MEWISVHTQLPIKDEYAPVLGTDGDKMKVLYYNGSWLGKDINMKQITHWMPLPELPEFIPETEYNPI
jgi:hypothetical protein